MDYLGVFVLLASLLAGACAFVAIIRPIARLGLGSRKRALAVLALSFVTFVAGVILGPPPPQGQPPAEPAVDMTLSFLSIDMFRSGR